MTTEKEERQSEDRLCLPRNGGGIERRLGGDPTCGMVFWITGLSGAGKSVIARRTYTLLKARLPNVVLVDGDEFRAVLDDDLGHHPADRLRNAYRIARFCRFLSRQGLHVVCATMSLFHECRAWNRANIPGYREVYVRVPMDVVTARDPKGLYGRALAGQIGDVVGVNIPFEEPTDPDLIIDNDEPTEDFTDIARHILDRLRFSNFHKETDDEPR